MSRSTGRSSGRGFNGSLRVAAANTSVEYDDDDDDVVLVQDADDNQLVEEEKEAAVATGSWASNHNPSHPPLICDCVIGTRDGATQRFGQLDRISCYTCRLANPRQQLASPGIPRCDDDDDEHGDLKSTCRSTTAGLSGTKYRSSPMRPMQALDSHPAQRKLGEGQQRRAQASSSGPVTSSILLHLELFNCAAAAATEPKVAGNSASTCTAARGQQRDRPVDSGEHRPKRPLLRPRHHYSWSTTWLTGTSLLLLLQLLALPLVSPPPGRPPPSPSSLPSIATPPPTTTKTTKAEEVTTRPRPLVPGTISWMSKAQNFEAESKAKDEGGEERESVGWIRACRGSGSRAMSWCIGTLPLALKEATYQASERKICSNLSQQAVGLDLLPLSSKILSAARARYEFCSQFNDDSSSSLSSWSARILASPSSLFKANSRMSRGKTKLRSQRNLTKSSSSSTSKSSCRKARIEVKEKLRSWQGTATKTTTSTIASDDSSLILTALSLPIPLPLATWRLKQHEHPLELQLQLQQRYPILTLYCYCFTKGQWHLASEVHVANLNCSSLQPKSLVVEFESLKAEFWFEWLPLSVEQKRKWQENWQDQREEPAPASGGNVKVIQAARQFASVRCSAGNSSDTEELHCQVVGVFELGTKQFEKIALGDEQLSSIVQLSALGPKLEELCGWRCDRRVADQNCSARPRRGAKERKWQLPLEAEDAVVSLQFGWWFRNYRAKPAEASEILARPFWRRLLCTGANQLLDRKPNEQRVLVVVSVSVVGVNGGVGAGGNESSAANRIGGGTERRKCSGCHVTIIPAGTEQSYEIIQVTVLRQLQPKLLLGAKLQDLDSKETRHLLRRFATTVSSRAIIQKERKEPGQHQQLSGSTGWFCQPAPDMSCGGSSNSATLSSSGAVACVADSRLVPGRQSMAELGRLAQLPADELNPVTSVGGGSLERGGRLLSPPRRQQARRRRDYDTKMMMNRPSKRYENKTRAASSLPVIMQPEVGFAKSSSVAGRPSSLLAFCGNHVGTSPSSHLPVTKLALGTANLSVFAPPYGKSNTHNCHKQICDSNERSRSSHHHHWRLNAQMMILRNSLAQLSMLIKVVIWRAIDSLVIIGSQVGIAAVAITRQGYEQVSSGKSTAPLILLAAATQIDDNNQQHHGREEELGLQWPADLAYSTELRQEADGSNGAVAKKGIGNLGFSGPTERETILPRWPLAGSGSSEGIEGGGNSGGYRLAGSLAAIEVAGGKSSVDDDERLSKRFLQGQQHGNDHVKSMGGERIDYYHPSSSMSLVESRELPTFGHSIRRTTTSNGTKRTMDLADLPGTGSRLVDQIDSYGVRLPLDNKSNNNIKLGGESSLAELESAANSLINLGLSRGNWAQSNEATLATINSASASAAVAMETAMAAAATKETRPLTSDLAIANGGSGGRADDDNIATNYTNEQKAAAASANPLAIRKLLILNSIQTNLANGRRRRHRRRRSGHQQTRGAKRVRRHHYRRLNHDNDVHDENRFAGLIQKRELDLVFASGKHEPRQQDSSTANHSLGEGLEFSIGVGVARDSGDKRDSGKKASLVSSALGAVAATTSSCFVSSSGDANLANACLANSNNNNNIDSNNDILADERLIFCHVDEWRPAGGQMEKVELVTVCCCCCCRRHCNREHRRDLSWHNPSKGQQRRGDSWSDDSPSNSLPLNSNSHESRADWRSHHHLAARLPTWPSALTSPSSLSLSLSLSSAPQRRRPNIQQKTRHREHEHRKQQVAPSNYKTIASSGGPLVHLLAGAEAEAKTATTTQSAAATTGAPSRRQREPNGAQPSDLAAGKLYSHQQQTVQQTIELELLNDQNYYTKSHLKASVVGQLSPFSNDNNNNNNNKQNFEVNEESPIVEDATNNNYMFRLLALIILITFVGNVLVCLSVIKVRKLRNPANYLLISLAVSDLCVASSVMPFGLYITLNDKWQLGRLLCNVYVVSDVTSCTASILNLCVISIDRYLAITRPLTYCVKRTTRLMLFLIFLVWFCACLISVPPLLISGNEYGTDEDPKCEVSQSLWYQLYATCISFYIPLIVMICLYYNIYTAAKKVVEAEQRATTGLHANKNNIAITLNSNQSSQEKMLTMEAANQNNGSNNRASANSQANDLLPSNNNNNNSSSSNNNSRTSNVMRERKASITLGVIMSAFTICWLPFFIIALLRPFSETVNNLPRTYVLLTLWLGYANSLLNPIIYVTFHHDFRNAFKHLLLFRCMTINEHIRKDEYKAQFGAMHHQDQVITSVNSTSSFKNGNNNNNKQQQLGGGTGGKLLTKGQQQQRLLPNHHQNNSSNTNSINKYPHQLPT